MTRRRPIAAERRLIPAAFFAMAEIDPAKVNRLVAYLRRGGKVPPVVVAMYGDRAMPLDGHHRLTAHQLLSREVDAWVVDGEAFDALCAEDIGVRLRAEHYVRCGAVRAMEVADAWTQGRQL